MSRLCQLFVFLALLQSCMAYRAGAVSEVLSVDASGRIWFQSFDVYDFPDLAGGAPVRTIHGDLTIPDAPVRGAVILSHGSGGPGGLHRRYAAWLNEQGFATFLVDHFGPRDVGSTVRDQIRVTEQGMMVDVIAARKLLATHPAIDADRIGHMGWSKGGSTGVLAAVQRFTAFAGAEMPLAFVAAFYPFCGIDLSKERLASPLLVLIGKQDDWTPPEPCEAAVSALQANGSPAEIEIYPDARHGFDSTAGTRDVSNAITVRDSSPKCLLNVLPDGRTRTLDGSNGVSTLAQRVDYLGVCGTRGVTYGGNATARDVSRARLKAFIDQHLP